MRRIYFLTVLYFCIFVCSFETNGSVIDILNVIKQLMEKEEYETAIVKLTDIEQICMSDTSTQVKKDFNINMGAALFFTEKYELAIPYLQSALQQMSYKPDDGDCNYLETLYGIASCYNNIKDYKNAESYYRKAIIINDIQPFACRIMTQIYTELIELYTKTNQSTLADLCSKQLGQYQQGLRKLNGKYDDWLEIVEEVYASLPSFDLLKPEDKPKIIETYSSILDMINTNIGKNNDEYIKFCSLYATTMQYKYYDTITAKELNMELIRIGHVLKEHKPEIASAYEDYLRLVSGQNEVGLVNGILHEAIDYYNATPNKFRDEVNLYEIVGVGFCNVGNYNDGVPYFEKVINYGDQLSITALVHLSNYYNDRDPQNGLSFFYKTEKNFNHSKTIALEKKHIVYDQLMNLNTRSGNYQEALVYGKKLISLNDELHLDENTLAYILTNCAVLCGRTNDLENADKIFASIDSIYNNLSEEYKIYYISNKGFTYLICGEYEKAIVFLKQSTEIAINHKDESNSQLEIIYHNLGRAYMLQHNYKEALVWLQKSYNLQITNNGTVLENTKKYINECKEHL